MTSILDYKEFKNDVESILKSSISLYNLKENKRFFDKNKHHPNTHVFYSNKYVLIEFSTLMTFPYSNSIELIFYFLDKDGNPCKTNTNQLNSFIGTKLDHKMINSYQSKTHLEAYRQSLSIINLTLKFIYSNLLNGTYTHEMYKNWLKKIGKKEKSEPSFSFLEYEINRIFESKINS